MSRSRGTESLRPSQIALTTRRVAEERTEHLLAFDPEHHLSFSLVSLIRARVWSYSFLKPYEECNQHSRPD